MRRGSDDVAVTYVGCRSPFATVTSLSGGCAASRAAATVQPPAAAASVAASAANHRYVARDKWSLICLTPLSVCGRQTSRAGCEVRADGQPPARAALVFHALCVVR